MNASPPIDLCEIVRRVVPQVFTTMLSLPSTPVANGAPSGDCVSGTIGIEGEGGSGAVYVHLTEAFARTATTAMLGFPESSVDPQMVNDVTSELTNMIGGGLKSALCDAGWPCGMSTPSIVRGPAFAVDLPPDMRRETFHFQSQGQDLAVEIHLKREYLWPQES